MKSNRGQRSLGAFMYEVIPKPSITSFASFELDFLKILCQCTIENCLLSPLTILNNEKASLL